MNKERSILLAAMEKLLAGKITCDTANTITDGLTMKEFPELYAGLFHYYDDEELREKDPEYKEFQDTELKKLIMHLKNGDIKKANDISFIHES